MNRRERAQQLRADRHTIDLAAAWIRHPSLAGELRRLRRVRGQRPGVRAGEPAGVAQHAARPRAGQLQQL